MISALQQDFYKNVEFLSNITIKAKQALVTRNSYLLYIIIYCYRTSCFKFLYERYASALVKQTQAYPKPSS